MKHKIDARLKDKVGYYQQQTTTGKQSQYFKVLSFDEDTNTYYIQQGRYNQNKGHVKFHVYKELDYAGAAENNLKSWLKDGYQKMTIPATVNSSLKNLAQLRATPKREAPKPVVAPEIVIPQLEIVEGNVVRIGNQVLTVNEDEPRPETIPVINPHYAFPELVNDVIRDLLEHRKILLTGHTGTGKTSLIDQIAARARFGTVRSNMNGQTTVHDFVGMWTVKSGETVWVDGVLPMAMKEGLWLIIDEIDCADASILAVLNAVLEKDGVLTLKEKGYEVVRPHKNFRLIATANTAGCMASFRPLYQGTNILNEAFLDRFRVYKVDYLPANQETQMVIQCVPKLSVETAKTLVQVANELRKSFFAEEISSPFSTRRLLDWAEMYLRHNSFVKSAENVLFSKMNSVDADTVRKLFQRKGLK